jgi:DNA repair protein REV1
MSDAAPMAAVQQAPTTDGVSPKRMTAARRAIADARRAAPNLQQRHRTSKDNDAYAKDFFGASRLHFIGSWKARFELICDRLPPAPPLPAVAPGCERVVLHIDMDCFFASIAAALRPELAGLPLAVSWGDASSPHAEIASASYEARAKGVRNGMWLVQALRCCPDLLIAPYEFAEYERAAEAMYQIVFSVTPHVMGVSVDECYADVTGLGEPTALAASLRARVRDATKCNASIGIGPNRIVARLATAQAKPDGMRALSGAEARELLSSLPVRTLPGIGHSTSIKLEQAGIVTCGDLATAPVEAARAAIGIKLAQRLQGFACGRDDRAWESRPVRKSVGAQASWGVRFALASEAEHFIHQLAAEVSSRLIAGKLRGRSVTLKIWRAMAGAPPSAAKGEMGHGLCDNLSRTLSLDRFTSDAKRIGDEGCKMLRELAVPAADVRGMGLAVGKLEGR